MLVFIRCDPQAGIKREKREKNTLEPPRSRSKIWHSVMCVLRQRETGGDIEEGREERWTDCGIEGDREGKE